MSAAGAFRLDGVFAGYPGRRDALSDVGLRVAPGRVTAVLGENGSGKSTLLKVLASVISVRRGEVRLDGELLESIPRRERARRLAYLPQSFEPLFPSTALEIVLLGRTPWLTALGGPSRADREIARQALDSVDAAALEATDIREMSGGERQRVLLARVLAGRPACFLLDEPTANLDPRHRRLVVSLLRSLVASVAGGGGTVVFSTHELDVAAAAADDVVLLSGGRVLAAGARREVLTPARLTELFRVPVEDSSGHLALRYGPDGPGV